MPTAPLHQSDDHDDPEQSERPEDRDPRLTVSGAARGAPLVVGVPPAAADTHAVDHGDARDAGADGVLLTAARLAVDLGTDLVVVTVDEQSFTQVGADGSTWTEPIDPDAVPGEAWSEVADALVEHVRRVLAPSGVSWCLVRGAGDPARELARVAQDVGARVVVVGARRATWTARVGEVLLGSVAARLSHHQHRPVVVVPAASRHRGERTGDAAVHAALEEGEDRQDRSRGKR